MKNQAVANLLRDFHQLYGFTQGIISGIKDESVRNDAFDKLNSMLDCSDNYNTLAVESDFVENDKSTMDADAVRLMIREELAEIMYGDEDEDEIEEDDDWCCGGDDCDTCDEEEE